MFSSNDTPAEEFALAAKLGATINLDDITHIDFLKDTIGYIPKTDLLPLQPRRHLHPGESEEGFQVMDNPGEAKYGMTREQMTEAFQPPEGAGGRGVRHPRLPGLQHPVQRLLPRPGRAFCSRWRWS